MNTSWPASFFNRRYLDMFMTRLPERLRFEADVISRYAKLSAQSSVADFCCGTGDLLHALHANHAIDGHGVELVADYVEVANSLRPEVKVQQGDALTFSFGQRFDVILNWFSSFGYFDGQSNFHLLENMAKHTMPGGRLVLEVYNAAHIKDNFSPVMTYERQWRDELVRITRASRLDADLRQLHQTWSFEGKAGTEVFETTNFLYEPADLADLVAAAGFDNIHMITTPTLERPVFDETATRKSPRLLLTAQMS